MQNKTSKNPIKLSSANLSRATQKLAWAVAARKALKDSPCLTLKEVISNLELPTSTASLSRFLKIIGDKPNPGIEPFLDLRRDRKPTLGVLPEIVLQLALARCRTINRKGSFNAESCRHILLTQRNEINADLRRLKEPFVLKDIPCKKILRKRLRSSRTALITNSKERYKHSFVGVGKEYKVNELWEIDSTFNRMGKGLIGRPFDFWVTSIIDVASRYILASVVHFTAPNTEIALHCLKKAILPHDGINHILLPASLQSDNHKMFKSDEYISTLGAFGINAQWIIPSLSSMNGIIERWHRTFKNKIIHGYQRVFETDKVVLKALINSDGELDENGRLTSFDDDHQRVSDTFLRSVHQNANAHLSNLSGDFTLELVGRIVQATIHSYNHEIAHSSLPEGYTPYLYYTQKLPQKRARISESFILSNLVTPQERITQRSGVKIQKRFYWDEGLRQGMKLIVDVPVDICAQTEPCPHILAKDESGHFYTLTPNTEANRELIEKDRAKMTHEFHLAFYDPNKTVDIHPDGSDAKMIFHKGMKKSKPAEPETKPATDTEAPDYTPAPEPSYEV